MENEINVGQPITASLLNKLRKNQIESADIRVGSGLTLKKFPGGVFLDAVQTPWVMIRINDNSSYGRGNYTGRLQKVTVATIHDADDIDIASYYGDISTTVDDCVIQNIYESNVTLNQKHGLNINDYVLARPTGRIDNTSTSNPKTVYECNVYCKNIPAGFQYMVKQLIVGGNPDNEMIGATAAYDWVRSHAST